MNNEPVAFIRQGEYGKPTLVKNPLYQFSYQAECVKWDDIPVFAHPPLKELTDIEIGECMGLDLAMQGTAYMEIVNKVRAVLKKAREK